MKSGRSMVGQERTAGMEINGQEQAGVGKGIRMGKNEQGQIDKTRWDRTGVGGPLSLLPTASLTCFSTPPLQQVLVPPLLVPAQGPVRHMPLQPALGA